MSPGPVFLNTALARVAGPGTELAGLLKRRIAQDSVRDSVKPKRMAFGRDGAQQPCRGPGCALFVILDLVTSGALVFGVVIGNGWQ